MIYTGISAAQLDTIDDTATCQLIALVAAYDGEVTRLILSARVAMVLFGASMVEASRATARASETLRLEAPKFAKVCARIPRDGVPRDGVTQSAFPSAPIPGWTRRRLDRGRGRR